jgi:hypothetical protein
LVRAEKRKRGGGEKETNHPTPLLFSFSPFLLCPYFRAVQILNIAKKGVPFSCERHFRRALKKAFGMRWAI